MKKKRITYKNNSGNVCTRVGTIVYDGLIYIVFHPADMDDKKDYLYSEIPIHKEKELISIEDIPD